MSDDHRDDKPITNSAGLPTTQWFVRPSLGAFRLEPCPDCPGSSRGYEYKLAEHFQGFSGNGFRLLEDGKHAERCQTCDGQGFRLVNLRRWSEGGFAGIRWGDERFWTRWAIARAWVLTVIVVGCLIGGFVLGALLP